MNEKPSESAPRERTVVAPAKFVAGGSPVDNVDVQISYGIIERFSEGLYSSPNKAFEELVSNSYDAGAERVWISVPDDLSIDDASICVIDDGLSMDLSGLGDLWHIGVSPKRRNGGQAIKDRAPIGKFGIGKLATYVLAQELTYLCRREDEYLAVTMNFREVKGELTEPTPMALNVVRLSREEAFTSLSRAFEPNLVVKKLFDSETANHWTAAVLTDLKARGREMQLGRLMWVLRTALPLSPGFQLVFNSKPLEPSKIEGLKDWTFEVGTTDSTQANWPYKDRCVTEEGNPAVRLDRAGLIRGYAELFSNSLQRGKSEEWGRSHGFFVKVRGRLVNLDDEIFGIPVELSHGTFTRFRMVVEADGLDDHIASPRESIQESEALDEIRKYLLAVFNRARVARQEVESRPDKDSLSAAERIADAPVAISQRPLRRMLRHAIESENGEQDLRSLLAVEDVEVLDQAGTLLESDDNLLKTVIIERLNDSRRLAAYDVERKAIVVNAAHPFVSNYVDMKGAGELLRDFGAAELLTQVYLLDEGFPDNFVNMLLERRNALLRALTKLRPRSAPVVAQQLRDSKNDEDELEDAVADSLELLGYDVVRIGGRGKPDGTATARLGRRGRGGEVASYSFTYDAKSVIVGKKEAIQAQKARTSILRVHREDVNEQREDTREVEANHTLLVAPDFEGANDVNSNLAKTCKNDKITPIRVEDLARLVEIFPLRMVSPLTLRPLFERFLPKDCGEFVRELETAAVDAPPIGEILDTIERYSARRDAVSVDAINAALYERLDIDLGLDGVYAIIRGLSALAPKGIWFDEEGLVSLNASVGMVKQEILATIDPLSPELSSVYKELLQSGS